MKKIIILVSIIVIILGITLIINITTTPQKQIVKYIESINFINYDGSNLYSKQISKDNLEEFNNNVKLNKTSNYEIMYFNIDTFQLTKDKTNYKDGITKNITPTYDYTNNKLTYSYRIYYNNVNIIMEGIYDTNTNRFTCKPTYSYQIDIEKSKEDICNKIELEIENFLYEAKTLIEEPTLLQYMQKQQ